MQVRCIDSLQLIRLEVGSFDIVRIIWLAKSTMHMNPDRIFLASLASSAASAEKELCK